MPPYTMHDDFSNILAESITSLLDYCKENNWAGYDPYDAFNSKIFELLPFLDFRLFRLALTQLLKRSPINIRPLLFVPKTQNPKAIALFLMAFLKLKKLGLLQDENLITLMTQKLINLRSPSNLYPVKFFEKDSKAGLTRASNSSNSTNPINSSNPYWCWGYNFDWQSRAFFLPKFVPNIICTTFAGNALIDAYNKYADDKYLDMAISAGNFLLKGLNITGTNAELCFSYTPLDRGQVHNANLLGAAFLSRLYSITHEKKFIEPACSAVQFSIRRQHEDGSWPYGEEKAQQWIDNFHTGYNLVALKRFSEYTGNTDLVENIRKGFQFYKENLFTSNGLPKYYHNQKYPIDIHSIAQSIITLVEFKDFDEGNIHLAERIFTWSLKNMQNKKGYFYYQKKRFFKNRIPYMRWSQAWMLYSMSFLIKALRDMNGSYYLSKK